MIIEKTKQLKHVYIVLMAYASLVHCSFIFYFAVICCRSPALDWLPFYFQTASHFLLYVCGFNSIDYINEEMLKSTLRLQH